MAKMAPNTRKAFDLFVSDANRSGLQQLDWERFYQFVRTAHRYRSPIWEQDVKQALIEVGFGEDYASHICVIYTHCWQMLGGFRSPLEAKEQRRWVRDYVADVKRQIEAMGH